MCVFRWKSKERSGILRLETSLFSGYELHSVNPVVLDGATFADLHYGSRGESVWFVFANVSLFVFSLLLTQSIPRHFNEILVEQDISFPFKLRSYLHFSWWSNFLDVLMRRRFYLLNISASINRKY